MFLESGNLTQLTIKIVAYTNRNVNNVVIRRLRNDSFVYLYVI